MGEHKQKIILFAQKFWLLIHIDCKLKGLKNTAKPGETKITANKVDAKLLQELDSALNQKYFLL